MSSIVCATRGGEGSRVAQMAAIENAKATQKPLYFLYVVDANSLDDEIDESLKEAILAELNWMGETLLRIAQRRADEANLSTEVKIRKGKVQDEIIRFVKDVKADLLVLGAPRGTTANVFGDDAKGVPAWLPGSHRGSRPWVISWAWKRPKAWNWPAKSPLGSRSRPSSRVAKKRAQMRLQISSGPTWGRSWRMVAGLGGR